MSEAPIEHEQLDTRGLRRRFWVISAIVLCSLLLVVCLLLREPNGVPLSREQELSSVRQPTFSATGLEVLADDYVSSESCQDCHQPEYESWHSSYHRTMTQAVSPETAPTVLKNSEVTVWGRDYRFEQKGDEFWVEMDDQNQASQGQDPQRIERRIVLMTGSHHMHVFWYATKFIGTPSVVPVVYLIGERRWIPRHSMFLKPPSQEFARLSEAGRWNIGCSRCHTTHPRPRDRSNSNSPHWDTRVVQLGIACESCHGPGAAHVAMHSKRGVVAQQDDPIVNPKNLQTQRSSQVCGQCHGVHQATDGDNPHNPGFLDYLEHGRRFRPGQNYQKDAFFKITRFKDKTPNDRLNYFWPDGMVRVSGREYSGLIESPCFQRGKLSCFSCHSLHASTKDWADDQLKAGMRGNRSCLQCHTKLADNVPAHTHHVAGSSGSLCMNCHMPHTTYGLLKAMRSHQIDSPRAVIGVQTGRIVACNQCHLDRTLQWTADYLAKWYGQKQPYLDEDQRTKAVSVLHSLKGDAGQRALTAWSFGWQAARDVSETDWMIPYLLTLMNDEYDAVRLIAFRSLRSLPGYENLAFDPFATPTERTSITTKTRDAWNRQNQHPHGKPRQQLLLDSNGQLDRNEYTRLLQQRNRRKVILSE